MASRKKENKTVRRRLASSWISTVISISLVLVLVGGASLVLLNARAVSDYFKENVQVSVVLKPAVDEAEAKAYQAVLDSLPFVRTTAFVSKEQGREEMARMLGEDFMDAFSAAPVPASVDLSLEAAYVSPDSLALVKDLIGASPLVDEVVYQESLVDSLNANLGIITSAALVLIGNTVRLSVFSKRFSVHTMRLVGATKGFIRRPFLGQAVLQGLLSALLALALLAGGLYWLYTEFPGVEQLFPKTLLALTGGIVLAGGIVICVVSTFFVVGSLVDMRKDELYS